MQGLEHYGARFGVKTPLQVAVKDAVEAANLGSALSEEECHKRCVAAAKKKSMGVNFLQRADRKKYGGLWSDLENQFTRGLDQYPHDLTSAYNMLLNYRAPPQQQQTGRRNPVVDVDEVSGLTFLQNAVVVPGTDGVSHPRVKCFNCHAQGHYASVCPVAEQEAQEAVQLLQVGPEASNEEETNKEANGGDTEDTEDSAPYLSAFTFLNVTDPEFMFSQHAVPDIIPDTWILLDSESTASVFKNPHFLSDIRPSPKRLLVHTNGGTQVSSQVGTVKNVGEVWYLALIPI